MTKAPAFASDDLFLVRRNPWVMALALSPLLGALALVVAGIASSPIFFGLVPHLTLLGIGLGYLAHRRNWLPRIEETRVTAGAEGVTLGDRLLPRAEIREGFVMPGQPPRVLLRRRLRPSVEIMVGSTEEARSLLRALDLDASQTVAHFRILSLALARRRHGLVIGGAFGLFYVLFVNAVSSGHHRSALGAPASVLFALALLSMLFLFLMPSRLGVGADGIALRWLWARRFVGFDTIDDVSRYEKSWGRSHVTGLKLLLRSNEEVFLPVTQGRWNSNDSDVALIEERIREAMDAFRPDGGAADAALLRRGDRGLAEWVSALRSIGAGANADLRTAPVPRERLFRVLEDPAAAPPDRAAAAVALGTDLDAESRDRLHAAAAATAAPRLRIVIEKAADGEEQAGLEAALAEIEAEAGEGERRRVS